MTEPTTSPRIALPAEMTVPCPVCGASVRRGAATCAVCGAANASYVPDDRAPDRHVPDDDAPDDDAVEAREASEITAVAPRPRPTSAPNERPITNRSLTRAYSQSEARNLLHDEAETPLVEPTRVAAVSFDGFQTEPETTQPDALRATTSERSVEGARVIEGERVVEGERLAGEPFHENPFEDAPLEEDPWANFSLEDSGPKRAQPIEGASVMPAASGSLGDATDGAFIGDPEDGLMAGGAEPAATSFRPAIAPPPVPPDVTNEFERMQSRVMGQQAPMTIAAHVAMPPPAPEDDPTRAMTGEVAAGDFLFRAPSLADVRRQSVLVSAIETAARGRTVATPLRESAAQGRVGATPLRESRASGTEMISDADILDLVDSIPFALESGAAHSGMMPNIAQQLAAAGGVAQTVVIRRPGGAQVEVATQAIARDVRELASSAPAVVPTTGGVVEAAPRASPVRVSPGISPRSARMAAVAEDDRRHDLVERGGERGDGERGDGAGVASSAQGLEVGRSDEFALHSLGDVQVVLRAANPGSRVAAFVVDVAVLVFAAAAFVAIAFLAMEALVPGVATATAVFAGEVPLIGALLLTVLSLFYFGLFEGVLGFTPGKRVCRLRTVLADGEVPGFGTSLLRALLMFALSTIGGVTFIAMPMDRFRRALHDQATGVFVVEIPRKA